MKTSRFMALSVCLALVFAPIASAEAQTRTVPRDTTLRLILNDRLTTTTSKVGDTFRTTVAQDVRVGGSVVIPRGAIVEGSVTQVEKPKRLGGLAGQAKLTVRFDRIRAHGESRAIRATLVSVHDPIKVMDEGDDIDDDDDNNVDIDEEGEVEAETDITEIITKGAIGIAAGALLGALFGNVSRGVLLGSIGGAIAILAPKGKHVELKEGTGFTVRLDRDLNMSIT